MLTVADSVELVIGTDTITSTLREKRPFVGAAGGPFGPPMQSTKRIKAA